MKMFITTTDAVAWTVVWVSLFTLLDIVQCQGCTLADNTSGNLVSDWSFDGGGAEARGEGRGWQYYKRPSLWKLEPIEADHDTVLRVSDDVIGQDRRSLALGPLPWDNHAGVFASQFIRPCNLDGPIQLTFASQGQGRGRLYILLHVAYSDDTYLKVKVCFLSLGKLFASEVII